jgi:hypothetical protein
LWDGEEDLILDNFWPLSGAISHVSIYGGGEIPEAASVGSWGRLATIGITYRRRQR